MKMSVDTKNIKERLERTFTSGGRTLPAGLDRICDEYENGLDTLASNPDLRDLRPEAVERMRGEHVAKIAAAVDRLRDTAIAAQVQGVDQEIAKLKTSLKPKSYDAFMTSGDFQTHSLQRLDRLERALSRQMAVDVIASAHTIEELEDAVGDALLAEDSQLGQAALGHACSWLTEKIAAFKAARRKDRSGNFIGDVSELQDLESALRKMADRRTQFRRQHSPSRRLSELERHRSNVAGQLARDFDFAKNLIFGSDTVRVLNRNREIAELRERMSK